MDIKTLKELIKKTGYIENKKIGQYFTQKYPNLLNEIMMITKDIEESYVVNRRLRARVKFLFECDLDINKIKSNNQWLTFDGKKDTFVDRTGDYRKRGWEKSKINLSDDYFTKKETIKILLEDDYYMKFLGKAKNRTLLKENPKLYSSIFKHTKFMDLFNKNNNKFSTRILVLAKHNGDKESIKCKKCGINFTTFNYQLLDYNSLCFGCFHVNNDNKYPQKGWFKEKYSSNWLEEYEKFICNNAHRLYNNNGCSKISQKIFWGIYKGLPIIERKKCYFKELNHEYYINNKTNFYFIDFKCGNKIIEFDGVYWHRDSTEKDTKRNSTYENLGYELLIINENDINKDIDELINKCIKFLKNEN
jgi:hypothetical protein